MRWTLDDIDWSRLEAARVPPDLLAAVNQESEAWARDQLRASIQEAYEELGDWQKVRVRFGGG